jgi:AcrR family transcriptional regulator
VPESSAAPALSRRDRKKQRTRRDLYDAAVRLFLRDGVGAVTIDAICTQADVARATFFLHFPTKDAVLAEYGRQVTDDLATHLADDSSAVETLRHALEFLCDRALEHAPLMQPILHAVLTRPAAIAEHAEQGRNLATMLAAVVRRGQRAGELRRGLDPQLAAAVVVSAYFGIVGEWMRRGDEIDLRASVAQSLDIVLRGLARPRPRPTRGG